MSTSSDVQAMSRDEAMALFRDRRLEPLAAEARRITKQSFGSDVYLRGLIEYSNYCGVDCLYCGIRRTNTSVHRYRLTTSQILDSVRAGYVRGLRTFVLQGGEDSWFSTEVLARICEAVKTETSGDAALTLSCGIRPKKEHELGSGWGQRRSRLPGRIQRLQNFVFIGGNLTPPLLPGGVGETIGSRGGPTPSV